jgi:F420-0:gamma-glutamyl ligase
MARASKASYETHHAKTLLAVPGDLASKERQVWLETVAAKPADWFGKEHVPILRLYVMNVAEAERLQSVLAKLHPSKDAVEYYRLYSLAEKHTRLLLQLARSMRLTQQSQIRATEAGTKTKRAGVNGATVARPWEH